MIVYSLKKTLEKMIFNPLVFLPGIALTIFGIFLSELFFTIIDKPLTDFILNYEVLVESNILFIILTQYPIELLLTLGLGLISMTVLVIMIFSIARFAKKESIMDAINTSISEWKKALTLGFYGIVVLFVGTVLMFIIGYLFEIIEAIITPLQGILSLIVFPIILFGGMALILTKTIFVLPAIIDTNLKKAIQESWTFTNKKFWKALLLIIILLIASLIIGLIGEMITAMVGADFEMILLYASDIIASTLFVLAISYYYYAY